MKYTLSQRTVHFFHLVSNIRPVVWMGLYIIIPPIFALIYWALPDYQFRMPEGVSSGYLSWLYYSIVTITTLGFGDYTPAHVVSQAVTAVEVTLGLVIMGLFLNAVGSMKSEIDVESEIEKQKALHRAMETEKLLKSIPMVLDSLNIFLTYCYAVTTPNDKRAGEDMKYNPDFKFQDLRNMFEPSGLPFDRTRLPAVERLLQSVSKTSLTLDSLQQRIDLTLWPELLEDCFSFVANYQMFANTDVMFRNPDKIVVASGNTETKTIYQVLNRKIAGFSQNADPSADPDLKGVAELFNFIKENAALAVKIETLLSELALLPAQQSF